MSEKELETYLKLDEILKALLKNSNKNNHYLKEIHSDAIQNKKARLNNLLKEAKDAAFEIMKESRKLVDSYSIYYDDFEKLILSVDNLLEYLNKRVGNDDIMKEVRTMEKTLCDPLVKQQGVEEGIKQGEKQKIEEIVVKMLESGVSIERVAHIAQMTVEEIKNIIDNKKN